MGGDLGGNSCAKDAPLKGKNDGDLCGGRMGEMSGKVAEIEFFRFSKAAISRQTKGQNPQTSGSF